jgi:glycosyltransferase involved in cell wall biosynthesis
MTILAESVPLTGAGNVSDERWRERALREQEAALPKGSVLVTCFAPFGAGGLGRHLQEIVEAMRRAGNAPAYICEPSPGAAPGGGGRGRGLQRRLLAPIVRLSPAWQMWSACVDFDRFAARRLSHAENLIAFNGTALTQFSRAAAHGISSRALVSATAHVRTVVRQHELAYTRYPLERSWATRMVARNLAEYERAERIYVSSRRVWESFIAEGVPEERLARFPLTPGERFAGSGSTRALSGRTQRGGSGAFEVLYIGSLSVVKGVPLLVDAFARLAHRDMRLVLLGGWATRGMRRFIERAIARDPRIEVRLGDPLPRIRAAQLYVHPSYDDGFGYAPTEALAAGVPAVVSDSTGMKELVVSGRNGLVVPTGDLDALTAAIDTAYRGELLRG